MSALRGIDRKVLLSTGWTFVLFNMVYADIIGMLRPGYIDLLDQMSRQLSPGSVLTFSVLMEVPIGMVLLSRVLERKANRWANLVAVPISILYVVFGGWTNPPASYLFFGSVEILTMLGLGVLAWTWPVLEGDRPVLPVEA